MVANPGRYRAFISYSHSDSRVAAWLHRSLESYRIPKRLRGTTGEFGPVPNHLHPIFRDREELASSDDLASRVREVLFASDALIVTCSPQAARSRWVNEEIRAFRQQPNGARVYCLIVSGEPNSGDENECFPPALRYSVDADGNPDSQAIEPIAADLRPGMDGKALAKFKLLAGLLGIGLDDLRRREAQRRHRRTFAVAVASLAGMTLALILATTAWIERNHARREQARAELASSDAQRRQVQAEGLLGYMLDDLRPKLEKVGQLNLLDSVDKKASNYFSHLNPRDLNDATLARQAQTLTDIGQVRLSQGRNKDALASFRDAYKRSKALVNRHPHDGKLLFDRGQAEYWVGNVYWQSREMDRAQTWLTRYRDTCRAVYAINPGNLDWERELAYGNHNLAVLEFDRGQLEQASAGFKRSRERLESVLTRTPNDDILVFEISDEVSWQGNVQEQLGHLATAQALFAAKADTLKQIAARHPDNARWRSEWSSAQLLQSRLMRVQGNYKRADTLSDAAVKRLKALTTQDPQNKQWSLDYAYALIVRAQARLGAGERRAARGDLAMAGPILVSLARNESVNRYLQRAQLDALALQATLAARGHDAEISKVFKSSSHLLQDDKITMHSAEETGRYATALIAVATAEAAVGSKFGAKSSLAAARKLLAPLQDDSRYWRILDPWIRLSLLSGNDAVARRSMAKLRGFGYVPLFPWPTESHPGMDRNLANTGQAKLNRHEHSRKPGMRHPVSRPTSANGKTSASAKVGDHHASSRGVNPLGD